jgi:hypothetical protein
MDPITSALLAAIAAAAKEKAVGAAVDLVVDAAKGAAQKLRGLLPDGNEAKQARVQAASGPGGSTTENAVRISRCHLR